MNTISFLLSFIYYLTSVLLFSVCKVIRDALHKAFWDILESELNDDPPVYGQAIRLLGEIREVSAHSLMFTTSLDQETSML